MIQDKKVLVISSELVPYMPQTEMSTKSFMYSKAINDNKGQTRIFMPCYGSINEKRHQLHEVIRLSGINLIVNSTDNPLIIKVASIPKERIQVYFIQNESLFDREGYLKNEKNIPFKDNNKRLIFFTKGVIEIVKKLNWEPSIIHLHGWFTNLFPLYIREYYKNNPLFSSSKIITSIYKKEEDYPLNQFNKMVGFDIPDQKKSKHLLKPKYDSLSMLAAEYSDGIIFNSEVDEKLKKNIIDKTNTPFIEESKDANPEAVLNFYNQLIDDEQE